MQAQIAAAPRATSPRRSALRKVSPRGPQRFGTPERRASFRDQSPSLARESSVADVHTFALSAEEKQEKAAAAAPSLAKAAEAYAEQASGSSASGLPAAVLPPGWDAVVSQSSGDTYYRNVVTEATQWEIPQYPVLPPGWTHGTSTSTGNVYYVAPDGESTYTPPNKAGKPFKPKTKGVPLACCAKPSNKTDPPSMFPLQVRRHSSQSMATSHQKERRMRLNWRKRYCGNWRATQMHIRRRATSLRRRRRSRSSDNLSRCSSRRASRSSRGRVRSSSRSSNRRCCPASVLRNWSRSCGWSQHRHPRRRISSSRGMQCLSQNQQRGYTQSWEGRAREKTSWK